MKEIIAILGACIGFMYILLIYILLTKNHSKYNRNLQFYNAILNVYKNKLPIKDAYEQLSLCCRKMSENLGKSNGIAILDMLEDLIYYQNTYSDKHYKNVFRSKKDPDVQNFVVNLLKYIKDNDPFASVPTKEASLLTNIKDAITKNNIEFGQTALVQLSNEIMSKEKLLKKQENINIITIVISIVGLIFTVFFGIVSIKYI